MKLVKRIGDKQWYQSNDMYLQILFHYLFRYQIKEHQIGINYIKNDLMKQAMTKIIESYEPYNDDRYFIKKFLKVCNVYKYYDNYVNFVLIKNIMI